MSSTASETQDQAARQAARQFVFNLCRAHQNGFSRQFVTETAAKNNLNLKIIVPQISALIKLEIIRKDEDKFTPLLTSEEIAVYQLVCDSGDQGVTAEDVSRSIQGLQTVRSRLLANLVQKGFIQQVASDGRASRKLFVRAGVQAAATRDTTAAWRTMTGEFDMRRVNSVCEAIVDILDGLGAPISLRDLQSEVQRRHADVSSADVAPGVEALIMDGQVDDLRDEDGTKCYRRRRPEVRFPQAVQLRGMWPASLRTDAAPAGFGLRASSEEAMRPGASYVPCLGCPYFSECGTALGAETRPEACAYLSRWLLASDVPDSAATAAAPA